MIFRVFELVMLVMLAPVRIVSLAFGHGLRAVFQFPARLLGVAFSVAGYLFVLLLFIAMAVAFFSLMAGG